MKKKHKQINQANQSEIKSVINLFSDNKLKEALEMVSVLINKFPQDSILLNIRGACEAGLGSLQESVKSYKKAIELNPNYAKAFYNLGGVYHEMEMMKDSIQCYKKAISLDPYFSEAHNNLGNVYKGLKRMDEAVKSFQNAIDISPNYIEALFSLALVLQSMGSLESIEYYKKLLTLKPDFIQVHINLANHLKRINHIDEAIISYKNALDIDPNNIEALNNLGNVFRDLGQLDQAIQLYKKAIRFKPDYPMTHHNLGVALKDFGKLEEAIKSYKKAIMLHPNDFESLGHLGETQRLLGNFHEAIESYKKALLINPKDSNILNNLGVAYRDIGQLDDAIISYQKSVDINPNDYDAYNNLGIIFSDLGLLDDGINSYECAIKINPNFAAGFNNMAILLTKLNRWEEAQQFNQKALIIKPEFAEGLSLQGQIFTEMNRLNDALISFQKAVEVNSDLPYALGKVLFAKMNICDWSGLAVKLEELSIRIQNNDKVIVPFELLCLIDDPDLQGKTSVIYSNDQFPKNNVLPKIGLYSKHDKIRVGYFSADFRIHPVATLTAELYEIHNRDLFEIHAFSFGPDTNDEMNLRIKDGVDYYHDVLTKSPKEIALLARSLEIDIAVDLGGYTAESRTGIFSISAAPIQVCYIGVLSTMGTDYYDYLIVGHDMIPKKNQKFYSEKIVYLPSYQVNDSKEKLPDIYYSRSDFGLPDRGFIFCCLNNTYKITPGIFDSWARILERVEDSVMMIYVSNKIAKENLSKEIKYLGINANRLIFVEKLPRAEYLARYRLADLFLDTHPYNAGTTASDALRMGLPILTLNGNSFNSREAASIISAVNLPEMITKTNEEYESLAIELAENPKKYKVIKEKLAKNLHNAPLFNTPLFVKNLESTYEIMYEKYHQGLEPDHIYLND